MFLLENGVMWGILLLSLVCLTVFIVLYKTAIEVDDVVVAVDVDIDDSALSLLYLFLLKQVLVIIIIITRNKDCTLINSQFGS